MLNIGMTQRVFENQYHERWDVLAQSWTDFLAAFSARPVPIPNRLGDISQFTQDFGLDGIILTGGNDLAVYGGQAPERDALEDSIISYSLEKCLPIIGVCRGLQVIHNYFGGALERLVGHAGVFHPVQGKDARERVNSYHNFGFRQIHPDLAVLSAAMDGSIEAVAHKRYPIFGVMWHPERNEQFDPFDIEFFQSVFKGKV